MSLPKPTPFKKKKAKNMIPEDELVFWIEKNVNLEGVNVNRIRDHFLWSKGDVERHRLDIFDKYYPEGAGEFCWTNRIAQKSFFLHYNTATKTITDKTVGRVEEKKKGAAKLNGIAKGGERIGKSFR